MKYLFIYMIFIVNVLGIDNLREKALSKGLKPIPKDFSTLISFVDDPHNPISREKITLGKKLFFDKNLSKDRTIACASCHDIKKGGADGKPTAIGYQKLENPSHLNSPTILNTAFSKHFFWDGRADSLREQAKEPMQAPFEMASTSKLVEQRVKENSDYIDLFNQVFKEENPITFENITKAIAVYEKTLMTHGAYDDFLEGDNNALSDSAQKGLNLFIDIGCKGCHFGTTVGGQKIQKFPLIGYNSFLNISFTYNEISKKRNLSSAKFNFNTYRPFPFENMGGFMGKDGTKKFRVPILRNISRTAPYFHNGVVKTLREAIFIMGRHQVGINFTEKQIDHLEAFLKSLDGKLVDYGLEEHNQSQNYSSSSSMN